MLLYSLTRGGGISWVCHSVAAAGSAESAVMSAVAPGFTWERGGGKRNVRECLVHCRRYGEAKET